MEYAHKVKQIEVGKTYLVAHVQVYLFKFKDTFWMPVLPHKHHDPAFFNHEHFHIDGRFQMDSRAYSLFELNNGKTNNVICTKIENIFSRFIGDLKYMPSRCVFDQTGLNLQEGYEKNLHVPIVAWMETMKGQSCAGGKCPHYGVQMQLVDGKYICPLHGLVGDAATEKII